MDALGDYGSASSSDDDDDDRSTAPVVTVPKPPTTTTTSVSENAPTSKSKKRKNKKRKKKHSKKKEKKRKKIKFHKLPSLLDQPDLSDLDDDDLDAPDEAEEPEPDKKEKVTSVLDLLPTPKSTSSFGAAKWSNKAKKNLQSLGINLSSSNNNSSRSSNTDTVPTASVQSNVKSPKGHTRKATPESASLQQVPTSSASVDIAPATTSASTATSQATVSEKATVSKLFSSVVAGPSADLYSSSHNTSMPAPATNTPLPVNWSTAVDPASVCDFFDFCFFFGGSADFPAILTQYSIHLNSLHYRTKSC